MCTAVQISRINTALYALHQDISQPLNAAQLAQLANYSEQHFHRVFRQVTGESVNVYSRRIRLEAAANQLMFDVHTSVIDVAQKCGFQSLSSFSKAFKAQFNCPPGQWRSPRMQPRSPAYLSDPEITEAYHRLGATPLPPVQLIELPQRQVAYLRHTGYGRQIEETWQQLNNWAKQMDVADNRQFGLHHSNPLQTPLAQCRYVACIEITEEVPRHRQVNALTIPAGLHAKFDFSGVYGELLPQMTKVWQHWLPASSFTAKTTPAFVEYHQNQFLNTDQHFELSFYLPLDTFTIC